MLDQKIRSRAGASAPAFLVYRHLVGYKMAGNKLKDDALPNRYRVRFDPEKIIGHFGGDAGAITALQMVGMNVEPKLLQKQRERGRMPTDMVASLALASVKARRPLNLYECLLYKVSHEEGETEHDEEGN